MIDLEQKATIDELTQKFSTIRERLGLDEKRSRITVLEKQREDPAFWQDQEKSKLVGQELAMLAKTVETCAKIETLLSDIRGILELLNDQEDPQLENEFFELKNHAQHQIDDLETETFLSGPYDSNDAILSIHAGQGGQEAMDWASMVSRMYMRYAQRKGWDWQVLDTTQTEDGMLKSMTVQVRGAYAYGLLKHDSGAHRLVRLSPFNADNLRQTSFVGVEILPYIPEDSTDVEIKPDEIEWQFTRAGGHGGQNVNKVNTAVILHYIPLDIIVECRQERYQEQNKKNALAILKSKLAALKEQERREELSSIKGEHKIAGWGNQIRNYVLHPYHLVKDTRTKVETSDTQAVLDGDLDLFTQSNIRML